MRRCLKGRSRGLGPRQRCRFESALRTRRWLAVPWQAKGPLVRGALSCRCVAGFGLLAVVGEFFEDAVELLGIANEKRPVSTVDGYSTAGLSETVFCLAYDFDDYGSVVNVDESSCSSGGLSLVIHVCWVRGFLG